MASTQATPRRVDPLLGFALIALVGFAVARWFAPATSDTTTLDPAPLAAELAQLEDKLGRPLTPTERASTTQQWKRREVLYREAIRLGMGERDPVVKTQLVRAMTHMLRSTAPRREPTDAELHAFLQTHQDRYGSPARWSFDLVRGDESSGPMSNAEATALLEEVEIDGLNAVRLEQLDARHHRPHRALVAEFGDTFAREIEGATPDRWMVLESSAGWMLARVSRVSEAIPPDLEALRAKVTEDWQRAVEAAHVEARLEEMSEDYHLDLDRSLEGGSP
jgi:hypothetical protein